MRLTLVNQYYVPDLSPTAHLVASLAEHRARRGDAVRVIASRGGYVAASRDTESRHDNPRIHRIWTPKLGKATKLRRILDYACFYLGALLRLITLPRQDAIVSLTTPPFIALAALAHKLLHPSTRLILWNMDCYPEVAERTGVIRPGGALSRSLRWLNRRLMRRMERIICLDTAMAELLNSHYAPADRPLPTRTIANWEPAELFPRNRDVPPWEAATRLGLDGSFVVLYLGNTGYGHRFDTVTEAAKLLSDEPVKFLFVGGGSRWQELESAVEADQLTNVLLHGYVQKEQTPAVMGAAHCALITMRDEMLGVVSPSKLHGNLAMKLPIAYVGPAKSNVDDAIEQFGCGQSFRHGHAQGLAAYIRQLRADQTEYEAMRQRARQAFEARYCDTQALGEFDRVLDETAHAESGHAESTRVDASSAP